MLNKWIEKLQQKHLEKDFENKEVVSTCEWIATVMIMIIPIVNIVMLLYWAFADKSTTPSNKVNWARGTLIVIALIVVASGLTVSLYLIGLNIHNS